MSKRSTVYNNIVTPEKYEKVNSKNKELGSDFLEYLKSIDRSPETINAYASDLRIFWVWLLDNCDNKFFVDINKREIAKFQSYCLNEYGWSSARMRRVKAALSSLSNYIEAILDDEFEGYRPIVRKIENPVNTAVREKTVFTKQQMDFLLNTLLEQEKYDQACMLALAIASGRRKAELPRMKLNYFSEDNIIYGSLYKTPEKVKTKGRGSKGKEIYVYTFKKDMQPYLDKWIEYRKENNIESEWLIPHKVGNIYIDEQVPISTMDTWAEQFSKILEVPFYWHSVRHFFVSEASRASLPDDIIKELVGWNSLDMVSIYKDIEADEQFAKYFDENGIKQVEQKTLSDI